MDGLSVASSILQLLSAARKAWTLYVNANKDIQEKEVEVGRLSCELDEMDRFFRAQTQPGIQPGDSGQAEDLGLVSQFRDFLTRMDSILNEVRNGQGISQKSKKYFKWIKGRETVNGHGDQIGSIRGVLHTRLLIRLK